MRVTLRTSLGSYAACVCFAAVSLALLFAVACTGGSPERADDRPATSRPDTGTPTPEAADPDGVGLAGEPPPELLEVFDSLPVPEGFAINNGPASTGGGLLAGFYATGEPEQVLEFYNRELAALGWQPDDYCIETIANDGTRGSYSSPTLVKDDLRIHVGALPNTKAPQFGPTRGVIEIRPRDG